MQLKGVVTYVWPITRVGKKQIEKQEIVVSENEHDEEYKNNSICVLFLWEKIDILKDLIVWDTVTVHYNTKVIEYEKDWNKKIFNNVNGWKLDIQKPDTAEWKFGETENTDLPF